MVNSDAVFHKLTAILSSDASAPLAYGWWEARRLRDRRAYRVDRLRGNRVRDPLHDQSVRPLLLRCLRALAECASPVAVDFLAHGLPAAPLFLHVEPSPERARGAGWAAYRRRRGAL